LKILNIDFPCQGSSNGIVIRISVLILLVDFPISSVMYLATSSSITTSSALGIGQPTNYHLASASIFFLQGGYTNGTDVTIQGSFVCAFIVNVPFLSLPVGVDDSRKYVVLRHSVLCKS
jgi:hypothetical protein